MSYSDSRIHDPVDLPLDIVKGVRAGSVDQIDQLGLRIPKAYAHHSTTILDSLLAHVAKMPDQDTELDGNEQRIILATFRALESVCGWCIFSDDDPLAETTTKRLLDASEGIMAHILRVVAAPSLVLEAHATTCTFLSSFLTDSQERITSVAENARLLDVAIALWTRSNNGDPVLYPSGPKFGDTAMDLVAKITSCDAKAMASAIMRGRICTPESFVDSSIQRMRCLMSLNKLQHLGQLPDWAVSYMDFQHCVSVVDGLVHADAPLRELFMARHAPAVYLKVLSAIVSRSERSSDGIRPIHHMEDFSRQEAIDYRVSTSVFGAQSAEKVITWVASPLNGRRGTVREMREIISEGTLEVLAAYLSYLSHEGSEVHQSILNMISPYLVYPRILRIFVDKSRSLLTPKLDTLSRIYGREDREAKDFRTMIRELNLAPSELLDEKRQHTLCDNLKHSLTINAQAGDSSFEEKMCSGCHSVVYCSRQCQAEDWKSLHSKECSHMYKEYTRRRYTDGSWYSIRDRKYHVNVIRHAFESSEQTMRTMPAVNPARAPSYNPADVIQSVSLHSQDKDHKPGQWTMPVKQYLTRRLPLVPEYLQPRLKGFISIFLNSFVARGGGVEGWRAASSRMYDKGTCRMMERAFRCGDIDINLVTLLRQNRELTVPISPWPKVRPELQKFVDRHVDTPSSYEFVGSLVYTSERAEEHVPRYHW